MIKPTTTIKKVGACTCSTAFVTTKILLFSLIFVCFFNYFVEWTEGKSRVNIITTEVGTENREKKKNNSDRITGGI